MKITNGYKLLTYQAHQVKDQAEDVPSPRQCLGWWLQQEFEPTWYGASLYPENCEDAIRIPYGPYSEIFRRLEELGYGNVSWYRCWVDYFPNTYIDEHGFERPISGDQWEGWIKDGKEEWKIGMLSIYPTKKLYLEDKKKEK